MCDDFRHECIVFLLRVLFIEDAVLRLLEPEAAETILHAREAAFAIEEVLDVVPAVVTEENILHSIAAAVDFVTEFAVEAEHTEVHAVLRAVGQLIAVRAVLQIFTVETFATVPALEQVITG